MGKNVVVAGRSKNVGMPIAMLLHTDGRHERPGGWLSGHVGWLRVQKSECFEFVSYRMSFSAAGDATVTISHRYTPKEQLRQHTKIADIIVAAAGLCNMFLKCLVVRSSKCQKSGETALIFKRAFCKSH